MTRGIKRDAEVPDRVIRMSFTTSKNDLLEVAFEMAGLLTGECDNKEKASDELINQVNRIRKSRSLKEIIIK